MKEIIEIIKDIIEKEYKLLQAYLNPRLSDSEYQKIFEDYASYFHSSMDESLGMYKVRDKSLFEYPEDLEMYLNSYQKRQLFQVLKYLNPVFGKELASQIDVNEIFVCFLNGNQVSGRPTLSFNDTYTLAKVDGNFKVIYKELFMQGKWERPHGYEPLWVQDYGKLEKVEKLKKPEEEASLKDFNKTK